MKGMLTSRWMVTVLICQALISATGCSQALAEAVELPPEVPPPGTVGYNEAIPKPAEVLHHPIGRRHSEPAQVVEYFRAVAEASDRVVLHEHGRSYQNRALIHAIVTAPENHARLNTLRIQNLELSDSPRAVSDEALADRPVIVYQGYTVHGDELSGVEAAMLLLNHLAAGSGPAVETVLENVVIIIDPMLNPDGHHRFATWVNQNRGGVPVVDPWNREYRQPWPGGRTNHYWFDLNRDWMPVRHPESRARLELFHHWRPQIVTDFHEMGSDAQYFFQPGVPDRVNPRTPASNQHLTAAIARRHADALDRLGTLYYTGETFDDFYPGKGSTYPDLNGAIGILFEQASSRALRRATENGILTYARTVDNQFATSLSTLQAAVELREELLKYQRDFYLGSSAVADTTRVTAYLIAAAPDPTRARELVGLLRTHRIRVHDLARQADIDGEIFPPQEAWIVPLDQPQSRLLKTLMERRTDFDSPIFYDVSTWTLPLAFGVTCAELKRPADDYLGEPIDSLPGDTAELVGGQSGYGYLIPWGRYQAPQALYRLQQAGLQVRVAMRPLSAVVDGEDRAFPRGTIFVALRQGRGVGTRSILPVEDAVPEELVHDTVRRVVEQDRLSVFAVETGLTPRGPDLGSRQNMRVLEKPEIALLTGRGAWTSNTGEVWHLLSERFGIPVSLLDIDSVPSAKFDRYNTLILAGGSYRDLDADKVKDWVEDGGRLIAIHNAVDWVVSQELVDLKRKEFDLNELVRSESYEDLSDARRRHAISGAIFEARLDVTHPLAYGHQEHVSAMRTSARFYEPSDRPGANVAVYTDHPLLSGHVSQERLAQAPGSAAIVAHRRGRGAVILFMDNPNFRAFWYGTNGLFLNALFFGQLL